MMPIRVDIPYLQCDDLSQRRLDGVETLESAGVVAGVAGGGESLRGDGRDQLPATLLRLGLPGGPAEVTRGQQRSAGSVRG